MAKMTLQAGDDYMRALTSLANSDEITRKAIHAGAGIVADRIRSKINNLPEDKFRLLKKDETFKGVPKNQKKDLLSGLGISKIDVDNDGNYNAKVGFDGYGTYKTKKYPKGLPLPLLARAIESGSEVRKKTPFVRTAVQEVKHTVEQKMNEVIDDGIKSIMKR